jgi:protein-S-isoprenylcysteine O-methyltransferase Ste14
MGTGVTMNQTNDSNMKRAVTKRMIQVIVQSLIIAATLFLSAWRLDWLWAWVYLAVGVLVLAVNSLILPRDLIAERGGSGEDVKRWDRVITSLTILPTFGVFVVTGLDERFDWSPAVALAVHLVGIVLMVLGQGLFTWSMVSNRFFSTAVRLQTDREQTVASSGPYRFVRHPGYVGYILTQFAAPLLLGSLWALIPAGVTSVLLVVRTALEDRTLQEELAGYGEYAARVRYRLVPGVW